MDRIRQLLTAIGVATSHPAAFIVVGVYVAVWLALSPKSFDWTAVATVAVWVMTLFIQRAEHRDTQAIHAKLDELLVLRERHGTSLRRWTGASRKPSRSIESANSALFQNIRPNPKANDPPSVPSQLAPRHTCATK